MADRAYTRKATKLFSGNELLNKAWQILDPALDGNTPEYNEFFLITEPLAIKGDPEAASLLSYFFMLSGDIEACDYWTVRAGELGAMQHWLDSHEQFFVLIARHDALLALRDEKFSPIEAALALQYHLIDELNSLSIYYGVKALRTLEAFYKDKFIQFVSNILLLKKSEIDDARAEIISLSLQVALNEEIGVAVFKEAGLDWKKYL